MPDSRKTIRLFEKNPKQISFSAEVISCDAREQAFAVELNQTLFYPTSGGQPHDTGTLNGIPVVEVIEQDERILHITEKKINAGGQVEGSIDWDRRFDHMQQHSGQHILSQCFFKNLKAETIGFHLGKDISTIDLTLSDISADVLDQIETEANRIIFSNQDVQARKLALDESRKLALRKEPSVKGLVRVVSIADFDHSACCGTHVEKSGEIGVLKIINDERYKSGTRITFVCGNRALKDFQRKDKCVREAGRILSAPENEMIDVLAKWREDRKQAAKTIKGLLDDSLIHEAEKLKREAEDGGKIKLIAHVFRDRERAHIQILAQKLVVAGGIVALLGVANNPGHLFFAVSKDIQLDIRPFLNEACEKLEGRGGGTAAFAQGSCHLIDQMQSVLESIRTEILKAL